jgi:hypothetical protein
MGERAQLATLNGDAHRESDPRELAETVLRWHWDIARCYCRVCVISRALLAATPSSSRERP